MTYLRPSRASNGFTIVELLVVIVIIAILAAITIIAFNGVQERARASSLSSSLQQATRKLALYSVDNGTYPATLADAGILNADSTSYQYSVTAGSPGTYCVTATTGSVSHWASSTATTPTKGACSGHAQGGAEIVTNLVHNPKPSTAYWFSSGTSTATVSFVNSSGVPAARSTRVNTNIYALYSSRSTPVSVAQAGDTYTILFTVSSNINTSITFAIGYGTGTSIIDPLNRTINLVANQPQTISHQVVIPSGYNGQSIYNKFYWYAGNGAVGDYFDVSNVMWVKGQYAGAFADGDSPNWSWSGAPQASTSSGPGL